MERSSVKKEEEVAERTTTLYHPCYFLEEALKALLKCLGVETETKKEEKTSHLKPHSDADLDPVTAPETSATSIMKSNQEAADPPSTATQNVDDASLAARRGPRRPGLSQGSGPQHN